MVFHEHDDKLLGYLKEEGQSIEPQWCLPLLLDYHHYAASVSGLAAAGLPQGGGPEHLLPVVAFTAPEPEDYHPWMQDCSGPSGCQLPSGTGAIAAHECHCAHGGAWNDSGKASP